MKVEIFDYKPKIDDQFTHSYLVSNVEDLVEKHRQNNHVAFVSIANSLLFMDGGSDKGYMNAIPEIQKKVQSKLPYRNLKTFNGTGRPYLPIGIAQMILPEGTYKFISSPSMFLPQKVTNTKNPYHTLRVALYLVNQFNLWCQKHNKTDHLIETVYTPFIATGWGGISYEKSYQLMIQAIKESELESKKNLIENPNYLFDITKNEAFYGVCRNLKKITAEQPKIYMNTEFGISVEEVLNNKE